MAAELVRESRRHNVQDAALDPVRRPGAKPGLRAAYWVSGAIGVLMVVASATGLLVDGLYRDGPWARGALRGGDLTTIAVAAPILVASVLLARRGSRAAQAVWLGALAYSLYNYAYYVFGAAFNDIFVIHIALFSLSIAALVLAVANIDVGAIAARFRDVTGVGVIGAFLAVVGIALGGLWLFLAIRFAMTGELMADLPADGIHLVFAIDTSLLVPALVISGILLWRRTPQGLVFGTAMAVMGAMYQVNLLMAGVFQANADVPGVKAFPLEGIVLASGFALATLTLLLDRKADERVLDQS
ncbi:MAG TPA: hypothetical protein VF195_07810 [Actinomycetota bacterium]